MPENISQSIAYIWPEITLALTFIIAMIFELLVKKGRNITGIIVAIGLLLALVQLPLVPDQPRELFGGMYTLDPFAVFFKYFVILGSLVIIIFSFQSGELLRERGHTGEYYCLLAALAFGMVLLAGSANLLMIYIAIELVSISSYILAGFSKSLRRSSEAALKYVIYGGISSGVMLYGITFIYGLSGSLDINTIRAMIASGTSITSGWSFAALMAAIVMMLGGFGYKISAVPFHFWTPDVYEGAPITITALLSVASKAAGFAVMIRFFYVTFFDAMTGAGTWMSFSGIHWNLILAVLSVLTMTFGNFVAIWQDNLKRMLAYSSIAHAGYILMGTVVMSDIGLTSVLLYLIIYFFMNLGAFYIVMVVADKIGSEHIDDYKGLGKRAPVIGVGFSIFLFSLTGLPPTSGFIGKLFLFIAVVDSPYIWLAIIGALNTVVSLYYYVRIMRNMYLREPVGDDHTPISFKPAVLTIVILFIIPNIVFCFYYQPLVSFAQHSIRIFLR